jgi:hypothetical protein
MQWTYCICVLLRLRRTLVSRRAEPVPISLVCSCYIFSVIFTIYVAIFSYIDAFSWTSYSQVNRLWLLFKLVERQLLCTIKICWSLLGFFVYVYINFLRIFNSLSFLQLRRAAGPGPSPVRSVPEALLRNVLSRSQSKADVLLHGVCGTFFYSLEVFVALCSTRGQFYGFCIFILESVGLMLELPINRELSWKWTVVCMSAEDRAAPGLELLIVWTSQAAGSLLGPQLARCYSSLWKQANCTWVCHPVCVLVALSAVRARLRTSCWGRCVACAS